MAAGDPEERDLLAAHEDRDAALREQLVERADRDPPGGGRRRCREDGRERHDRTSSVGPASMTCRSWGGAGRRWPRSGTCTTLGSAASGWLTKETNCASFAGSAKVAAHSSSYA